MAAVPPAFARGALRADAPRRAHYGRVFDVAFCPWDDSLFATAGEDETARVWRDETRARSGARAGVASHGACRGHRDEVVRVAWHPTMTILATGSADGTACLWRVAQPGAGGASAHDPDAGAIARVDVLGGHPEEVYGCAFVGDGSGGGPVLATASGTDLRLWDLESAKVVQTAPSPRATRDGPGRPEARRPGSSENENENERGGSVVPERWRPGYLMSLASDAGARGLLASACTDGSVKVWALDQPGRSATPIASLPWHDGAMVTATAFASDGDVLVSADSAGVVCATDVRTWTQTRRIKAPRGVYGICAAPNGVPWVAMCGGDGVGESRARGGGGRRPNRRARRRRILRRRRRAAVVLRDRRERNARRRRGVGAGGGGRGPRGPAGTLERARTFFDEGVGVGGGAVRGEEEKRAPAEPDPSVGRGGASGRRVNAGKEGEREGAR
jgi:WD40 repeat protein